MEAKKNDTNEFTYKTEILADLENKLMVTRGRGGGGRDRLGVWGGHVHTILFKMVNEQGPTVEHRELCSMFCDSLDGRGVWGRMDMCICNAESLVCPCELSQCC